MWGHLEVKIWFALGRAAVSSERSFNVFTVVHLLVKRLNQSGHSLATVKADSGCIMLRAASEIFLQVANELRAVTKYKY